MMHIQELLLSASTTVLCGKETVGDKVRQTGKSALWSDRTGAAVDTVVIHYISAVNLFPDNPYTLEHLIDLFCTYKVSAHFLISREGTIERLVPEDKKAWHAGGSIMPDPDNRQNVNEFSIGIELAATPSSGFTGQQYESLTALCLHLEKTFQKKLTYVGHDQIAGDRAVKLGLRSDVKTDPGPYFDWVHFIAQLDSSRI